MKWPKKGISNYIPFMERSWYNIITEINNQSAVSSEIHHKILIRLLIFSPQLLRSNSINIIYTKADINK